MDDIVDNILTSADATHIEKKPGVPLTFKYDPNLNPALDIFFFFFNTNLLSALRNLKGVFLYFLQRAICYQC